MNNIETSIAEAFKSKFPDYSDDRYNIVVAQVFRVSAVPTLIKCLKKNKFSGKSGKYTNVADIRMWTINVYDPTLASPAKDRPIDSLNVNYGEIENLLDLKEVLSMLEDINKSSQAEQLRRSVTETAAERMFSNTFNGESNVRSVTINIPLALPAKEGKYSEADKEFFSWWARDSRNNVYLRAKDGSLLMAPMKESEEPVIRNDSQFWAVFWKNYRNRIVELSDKVIEYAWSLKDSIEDADLDENRLRMKVDPKEKRSIITMIHQFLPKSWMNRLCLTLNIDQVDEYGEDGKKVGTQKFFKGFTLGFFPNGYVGSNPQPPTDENWVKMLAHAVPNIEISELAEAKRFTNQPKELAINVLQLGAFLPKNEEIPDLPKTWNMFFENRLGGNFSSQMYRIAKWVVGVLDEKNFGRRVLVVAGHGADGKSIFQNVLLRGFNNLLGSTNFAKILPVGAVDPTNTQNGLLPCMDSRVLFTADVTKVTDYLKSEVVKNITGCDEVTAQVKFAQPVTKSMAGVKIMVTTNNVTYLSDNYIDTRVSPIYFERCDRSEADWDAFEVKRKMVEEFPEFVRWCFAFAYAQDKALEAPIHSDPKVWSDTAADESDRAQWEALGSEKGGDPMFKYRKMDEDADIMSEDLACILENIIEKDPNGKVSNPDLRFAVAKYAADHGLRTMFSLEKNAARFGKLLSRTLIELAPMAEPFISHGKRGWKGICLKEESPIERRPSYRKIGRSSDLETQMPCQ